MATEQLTPEQENTARLDAIQELEVKVGFKVKDVPQVIRRELRLAGLPDISRVRFSRLNPRRKAKIADVVMTRYHKDLRNPDMLSNEQLAKLASERGEWTLENAQRMFDLMEQTQRLQEELFYEGFGDSDWNKSFLATSELVRALIAQADYEPADREALLAVFERWVEFTPSQQEAYTTLYATAQERETYSLDFDLAYLLDRLPSEEAVEAIHLLEDIRDKLLKFIKLRTDQAELVTLQTRHAKIFETSVESRRDQTEELARIYFCTEIVNEQDTPLGPLAVQFDALWDFPEEAIKWLLVELYMFLNGTPDATREYMEAMGFLAADREPATVEPSSDSGDFAASDVSPAPPTSRGASEPVAVMVASSSASLRSTT